MVEENQVCELVSDGHVVDNDCAGCDGCDGCDGSEGESRLMMEVVLVDTLVCASLQVGRRFVHDVYCVALRGVSGVSVWNNEVSVGDAGHHSEISLVNVVESKNPLEANMMKDEETVSCLLVPLD
jgi:hypothetical protein